MTRLARPAPLVFGEADPKDYMEPLCGCGHARTEHYDAEGAPPEGPTAGEGEAPCWYGWERDTEGCQCLKYIGPAVKP